MGCQMGTVSVTSGSHFVLSALCSRKSQGKARQDKTRQGKAGQDTKGSLWWGDSTGHPCVHRHTTLQWAYELSDAFNHLKRTPVTVEDVVGVTPPPQRLAREPVGVSQQHVQQKQPETN